ncbi:CD109 antigen-like isoform X3 [Physella acuta]|uniref:CD109 antigen-like isoform X3 n=1 Tax=Physella acuta TaxID=109671 RepID=UPI0027DE2582|nr:CD109 antigen-like isoform X3 [Physella acuta]
MCWNMTRLVAALLLSMLVDGGLGGSYFITAPQTIKPGTVYDLSVDILEANGSVPIDAILETMTWDGSTGRYNVTPVLTASGTFSKGDTSNLSIAIPTDVQCPGCQLRVRGRGPLQFERKISVGFSSNVYAILIQTDKAIYKPDQTVRFRALAVSPSLQLYKGQFNIEITDPNNNKIKIYKNLKSLKGVVENSLELSDQPMYGTWRISVKLSDTSDSESMSFDVLDYNLPRFEVSVILPPYGIVSDTLLTGSVKAKYTFGQPVIGTVELHVGPTIVPGLYSCGNEPKTTQITFEIDGEASFTMPKEDIQRAVGIYNGAEVMVTAFVKETTTGVRLNGSSVIKFYDNKYELKFLDTTPSVFKAGLLYTAFIQVATPDNMPPTENNSVVSAYTYVNYRQTVPDQSLYDTGFFSGTYPLPGKNLTLPASGVLPIDIDIPSNATSITIKVTYNKLSVSRTIEKTYSKSNNYLSLTLLDSKVKSGDQVTFQVEGTEPLNQVSYEVFSRGSKAATGTTNGNGQKKFTFKLTITPLMAPTAHIVAFYARGNDEIVADSLAFLVEELFINKVSVSFNKNQSQPNEDVVFEVTADPNSNVNILAVDQSVLLMKTGNDITPKKVTDAVSKFDKGSKPSNSDYALSNSAKNVNEIFSNIGLTILTDVDIFEPPRYVTHSGSCIGLPLEHCASQPQSTYTMPSAYYRRSYDQPAYVPLASYPTPVKKLVAVERIRVIFPETFLWSTKASGKEGKAVFKAKVPDTITSWVASAFATNLVSGLGVAPTTAMLTVFRPFFVSLTFPRSVTRKEQFVAQATVFNYLPEDLSVTVTLKGKSNFRSVTYSSNGTEILVNGDQQKTIQVKSQKQAVAYFPILATTAGLIDLEVSAQSTVAADAVRQPIVVKYEGAPVNYNNPMMISLEPSSDFEKTVTFTLPSSTVKGSEKARFKVTGDLLGSSLSNLESLLTLPMGCGEQSIAKFVPNIYILGYLKASGQLTQALSKKIVGLLEDGYQRQLTYQRFDGSFSAFGNYDESGSTWLTAQACKALHEAREYIYIDPQMVIRCSEWIIDKQKEDGSFAEFGKVIDKTTQGTGTGPALTSFALLSLLQTADLFNEQECKLKSNCYSYYRWGNATLKAKNNLEALVQSNAITEPFPLAVVSYTLSKAKSKLANAAFTKLLALSKNEGGLLFWKANSTVEESKRPIDAVPYIWRPPRVQARPIDILITSYAILTFSTLNRINESLPAIQWLTAQRNSLGGFASTQDTTVALNAISVFATKTLRPDTSLTVTFSDIQTFANFSVTASNALSLQIKETAKAPPKINVLASGTGLALAEVEYSFNVEDEISTPSFDVNTVLLDDDINSFNLMICTKWLWNRETGMVVQEVSIPSGFVADLSTLGNVAGLKRSEIKGSNVAIYFDKISQSSLCYSLRMVRETKVAKSQRYFVRTFDYYEPADQSTVFYQPKAIKEATICDVCNGCCP